MSIPPVTVTVRPLNPHETPQDLARTGYNAHAQTYLDWTNSKTSSRMTYLTRLLELLQSDDDPGSFRSPSNATNTASQPHEERITRILELGCGAGVPCTLYLAQSAHVTDVTAVDISSTQLEMLRARLIDADASLESGSSSNSNARNLVDKVELIEADMLMLSFEDGQFAAVTAFFSLIHLPRDDQRIVLEGVYGWLRLGGYLLANFGAQSGDETNVEQPEPCQDSPGDGIGRTGGVVENWLGMTAYWDGFGPERTKEVLREVGFEIVVADIVEEVGDARFMWVIARKIVAAPSVASRP